MFKAHLNENTGAVQSVREHCVNTAKLSRDFSVDTLKDINYAIGICHDIGKYQSSFQKRINGDNVQVEHSLCGALVIKESFLPSALSFLMEYCIAGHHTGIPDGGTLSDSEDETTLNGRLRRSTEDFSAYKTELAFPKPNENDFIDLLRDCKSREECAERFAFLTRYCFSCLTDADSIDTADFCNGQKSRSLTSDFSECLDKINEKLSSFSCDTELQKARAGLQERVYSRIKSDSEIYLMNLPTGSGKTLCSMKFALERAIAKGKNRIIYIIPYNSIIEQTADVFEKLFGDSAQILRHQSTFSYDDREDFDEDFRRTAKLATENWDAQIIITTSVQFFESIYANKRGKLRKLHNMGESVLIFDEAHMMPVDYLQPCLLAVSYITRLLNSEAIFLTATMPNFEELFGQYALSDSKVLNLLESSPLFSAFDKCSYTNLEKISREALISKASEYPSSLIVVNKKSDAKETYSLCGGKKYHLSTYMTPLDRSRVIAEIKAELARLERDYPSLEEVPADRRISVVSTSLIEAGVDLDFFTVFRELSGIDSILQAGGRCNREGKRKSADVFIFELDKAEYSLRSDERALITKGLLEEFDSIACAECINEYYSRLFHVKKASITKNLISEYTADIRSLCFRQYAEEFELIQSRSVSVVIPQDGESEALVEQLRACGSVSRRKLQRYVASINRNELEELVGQHAVNDFGSGIYCLVNRDYYSPETGIGFEGIDYYI